MRFLIILGSVRDGRQGIKAAKLIERTVRERGHEPVVIDPVEYDFGLLEKMYKSYPEGEAPAKMVELREHILSSDGVIVVSGEYNHSIPPALSNLIDHFLEEWRLKPSLITTYSAGPFGGVRALSQLRSLLGEIGTVSVSSAVAFPNIGSFSEDGTPPDERVGKSLNRALGEFEWYADAIARKKAADGSPF